MSAFLDDNGNAGASDIQSGDYRDTCLPPPREVNTVVTAGATADVLLQLANSCD